MASWEPEIIMPCICSKSGQVENVDLCKKIWNSETCNFYIGNSECNVKFDPAEYKGVDAFDKLKKDIIEVCRTSGFRATTDTLLNAQ